MSSLNPVQPSSSNLANTRSWSCETLEINALVVYSTIPSLKSHCTPQSNCRVRLVERENHLCYTKLASEVSGHTVYDYHPPRSGEADCLYSDNSGALVSWLYLRHDYLSTWTLLESEMFIFHLLRSTATSTLLDALTCAFFFPPFKTLLCSKKAL